MTSTDDKTIASYFEKYLLECEYSKGLRAKTIKTYTDVFTFFSKLMPELKYMDDFKPYVIQEFFKRLGMRAKAKGKPLKASSIRTYFNKLQAFISWLEKKGCIDKGFSKALVKPPNPKYEDEKALSEQAVSKLISTIHLHTVDDVLMQKRDLVIIYLLLYTGIRRGELLGLSTYDVDFQNKTLFINGKHSKSKKSRYIPLHFTVLSHLKSYLRYRKVLKYTSSALIVSTKEDRPLTDHGLKHWVAKYNRLSGIKFHVHQFRHTFACNLAKKNASVISIKNVLGHASVRMTEHYLRSIKTESARAHINTLGY